MSATWFTSDQHFNHANIITYCNRPWDTVEQMNQGLVDRWNSCVDVHDTVIVLGDMCWGKVADAQRYLEQLKGHKYLLPGNHDSMWLGHKRTSGAIQMTQAGFAIIPAHEFKIEDPEGALDGVLCSHFPYISDSRHDVKYDKYLPLDEGGWLLHGHVHDAWKVKDRQINVGVDVWDWSPVPESTLHGIMLEESNDSNPGADGS